MEISFITLNKFSYRGHCILNISHDISGTYIQQLENQIKNEHFLHANARSVGDVQRITYLYDTSKAQSVQEESITNQFSWYIKIKKALKEVIPREIPGPFV